MTAETFSDAGDNAAIRNVAMILFAVGVILLAAHYFLLQRKPAHGDENWSISLDINLNTKSTGDFIRIHPPYESEKLRVIGRSISHAGLRMLAPARDAIGKRAIQLRSSSLGTYQIEAEFLLQLSQSPHFHSVTNKALTTQQRQYYLADHEHLQLDDPSLESVLTEIGLDEIGKGKHADRIFQLAQELALNDPSSQRTAPEVLAFGSGNHHERALLMVALCRKAGIPARIVTGLELKDDPSANPDYWVEVNVNNHWVSYHPGLGYRDSLPANYVALDKLGDGFVSVHSNGSSVNGTKFSMNYDILIERIPETINGPDNTRREWYQVFMLDRLPSEVRQELALLMLLPLGALLSTLIRHFGGIHSYGVFTPTILALAMTYADWKTTALMLAVILVLVYFGRPAFHPKMSRTPRLSIIFTLVAVSMVMGVSILDYFSFPTDGHLILLPIVILTSLIDRFFSTVESLGYHTAFVRLVWTLMITITILPVLQLQWLGNWILRYPEFHFFTLSAFIFIASYPFIERKLPWWLSLLSEPEKSTKKKRRKPSPPLKKDLKPSSE